MFYNEKIFFLFHIKSKDACIVVGKEDELMPFVKVDVKKEIAERRERDPEFRKAWDRRKRQKADEVINTINKAVPLACIFYVIFSLILNVFLAFIAEEKIVPFLIIFCLVIVIIVFYSIYSVYRNIQVNVCTVLFCEVVSFLFLYKYTKNVSEEVACLYTAISCIIPIIFIHVLSKKSSIVKNNKINNIVCYNTAYIILTTIFFYSKTDNNSIVYTTANIINGIISLFVILQNLKKNNIHVDNTVSFWTNETGLNAIDYYKDLCKGKIFWDMGFQDSYNALRVATLLPSVCVTLENANFQNISNDTIKLISHEEYKSWVCNYELDYQKIIKNSTYSINDLVDVMYILYRTLGDEKVCKNVSDKIIFTKNGDIITIDNLYIETNEICLITLKNAEKEIMKIRDSYFMDPEELIVWAKRGDITNMCGKTKAYANECRKENAKIYSAICMESLNGMSKEDILEKIMHEFALSEDEAKEYYSELLENK